VRRIEPEGAINGLSRLGRVRKIEGKVGHLPAMKVYRESRFKAPLILKLGAT
jgi:hypothetical protein